MSSAHAENSKSYTSKASHAAHEAVDRVAERAERVEEKMRENIDASKEKSSEISKSIGQYVHDRPLASLGIAFVGGLLVSSLLRR